MKSLFDELLGKLASETTSPARRNGPRQDIGLLLFAEREGINELWKTADCFLNEAEVAAPALREAVERLRPVFGPRQ